MALDDAVKYDKFTLYTKAKSTRWAQGWPPSLPQSIKEIDSIITTYMYR